MKMTVAQIMHFVKASELLSKYVEEQLEALPVEHREKMRSIVSAANVVDNLANQLLSAEVNVRG